MNFIETFKQGKAGKSFGLTTGISALDRAINGIQRKTSIGIASAPKVGKTTLVDFSCLISPYLQLLELEKEKDKLGISWLDNVEWIYNSFEIDRVSKEFKIAAFFMAYDHNQYNFMHKGVMYEMNGEYLMGRQLHENPDKTLELIPVSEEHERLLRIVYEKRIVPMFGEFAADGTQIKKGKIIFIEQSDNPTGLYKYLLRYADLNGRFTHERYEVKEEGKVIAKERIKAYIPKNPDKFTIIITDHVRKLKRERGFTMKENIDKWLEYSTELRNLCHFTFIHVAHSNRGVSNVERLKFAGEYIFPTGDDVKDSGNLSEECTIVLTMMNPNDEKYNLEKHFGVDLTDNQNPDYRSIHLVESRNTKCPAHIQVNMKGGINMFSPLNEFG